MDFCTTTLFLLFKVAAAARAFLRAAVSVLQYAGSTPETLTSLSRFLKGNLHASVANLLDFRSRAVSVGPLGDRGAGFAQMTLGSDTESRASLPSRPVTRPAGGSRARRHEVPGICLLIACCTSGGSAGRCRGICAAAFHVHEESA